ncbi:uncharacterized protein [Rutidosis leptorrhynchoides]|uniref:uncharacterized protein n=1 Tax=Rutidosis leptorrhynchoides TaxID=125765 RepID=UPI003A9A44C4
MSSKSASIDGGSGSAVEAPESWEVADLEDTMNRLMLSSTKKELSSSSCSDSQDLTDIPYDSGSGFGIGSGSAGGAKASVLEDDINQVDQFLRDALQNPRERLSVLRLEQDVQKFIRDPSQQQFEFQQLPTSYLRLAAHRVAQHYSLQSMVLLDNSLPDGSGSRIIVRKTPECRRPPIRLADIPVNLPSEDSAVVKVAIKQRPDRRSHASGYSGSNSSKSNNSKSVEERKEEYNRARARIFNSSSSSGGTGGKPESEPRLPNASTLGSFGVSKVEEKKVSVVSDTSSGRGLMDSSSSSSRPARSKIEKVPVGQPQQNSRVAIFRDRDLDRKDPDYDRSYDRYVQRFDLGFGFTGGSYSIQPMYAPAVNYNTEFPQLGSAPTIRSQIPNEFQHRPLPQHLPGTWAPPSNPGGIGYAHPDMMAYNPNHAGARSSAVYMHSSQYPCQHPGMAYIQSHEHLHQPFAQSSHQQQADANFGFARPR